MLQRLTLNYLLILPEIDLPAHAAAWGRAFPDIMLECPTFAGAQGTVQLSIIQSDALTILFIRRLGLSFKKDDGTTVHPDYVFPLNPRHEKTLKVVAGVLKQLAEVFPSKYFSVGGDEVDLKCLEEGLRRDATTGASTKDSQNSIAVLAEFENQVFSIVRGLEKIPIVWQV
jgi:N-acetyl-beta-hexosaminidase